MANCFLQMLSGLQAVVTFGCIPVADDAVCFNKVAGFQDGYGDVFLTLVSLYNTYNMNTSITL